MSITIQALDSMKMAQRRMVFFLSLAVSGPLPAHAFLLSGQILEKGTRPSIVTANLVLEAEENNPPASGESAGNSTEAHAGIPTPIVALFPAPTTYSTDVDPKGNYKLSVPDGVYRLLLGAGGFKKITLAAFPVHQNIKKDFYLERQGFTLPEVVVSTEKAAKSQVSHETLSTEELASVPGTAGDVLRALQTLPGVNVAGDFSDALLIRGAGPLDNLYLLDGIPLVFPFHFGGILSTLNSDLVKSVDFSGGGFGPAYGNYYGGLIDITQRNPRQDRWGGQFEVTPILSEAGLEGPVTPNSSLSLSGRRSYLEVLGGFLSDFDPIPTFYDYQGKFSWEASPQIHLDFQAFGSGDNLGLKVQSGFSLAPNGGLAGNLLYHNAFDSQGVNFKWVPDGANILSDTAYHTTFSMGVNVHGYYFSLQSESSGNRFAWLHDFDSNARLQLGWEYVHGLTGSDIDMSLLAGQDDLDPFAFLDEPVRLAHFTAISDNVGIFLDQKFKTTDKKLDFSLGGRWDFQSYNHGGDANPRFSVGYHLGEDTVLKASYGFYTQQPFQGLYSAPGFGNPQLASELAASAVLGLEQKVGNAFSVRLEGYNKDLSRVIEVDQALNYNNNGSGFSRGLEIFLRCLPSDRFLGWVSYALSDSQRRDGPDSPLHPFIYDQPDVLTAVASYKITPGWDAGFKWHYATGSPYTPILGGVVDFQGFYVPVYGRENSARFPDYMRLDFSTSLKTVYDTWQWRVYLEIWNATGQNNVLTYSYNGDFSKSQPVYEFPFLPYIGIEASY